MENNARFVVMLSSMCCSQVSMPVDESRVNTLHERMLVYEWNDAKLT